MQTVFLNIAGKGYPAMAFGCWQLGGAYRLGGKADGLGKMDIDAASGLLDRAYESGIRVFDTADVYGRGTVETMMSRLPADTFIVTKFGNRGTVHTRSKDFSPAYFFDCIEASRGRLSRVPDLMLMHNPKTDFDFGQLELFELDRLRSEGRIAGFGVSCSTVAQAKAALENRHVQAVEVNFNLIDRRAEGVLFDRARELQKDVFLRAPFCSGFLTDRFLRRDHEFDRDDRRSDLDPTDRSWRIEAARVVAEAMGVSKIEETALRFCLSFEKFVVAGCRNNFQLESNIRYAKKGALDRVLLRRIQEIDIGSNPCW